MCLTAELSDAGGPRLRNCQQAPPARIRSSDFVGRRGAHCEFGVDGPSSSARDRFAGTFLKTFFQ
jgi:hypothetical protein